MSSTSSTLKSKNKPKSLALSHFMTFTKKSQNELIESYLLDGNPKSLSVITLNDLLKTRKKSNGRLIATLLHIKKSINKSIVIKDPNNSKLKTTSYYRFLLLADDNNETFAIIINKDELSKCVFAHHGKFSIGSKVVMSKPKCVGNYKGVSLIETCCIYPIEGGLPHVKLIPSGSAIPENEYCCYFFSTDKFEIEETNSCDTACACSCDGHYLDECYCSVRKIKKSWVFGVKFAFEEHPDLTMKFHHSHEFTKKFIHQSIIDNKGMCSENEFTLVDIEDHVRNQLKNKLLSFIVWFKPSKKEDEEDANLSAGHISKVVFPPDSEFEIFSKVRDASLQNDDSILPGYVEGVGTGVTGGTAVTRASATAFEEGEGKEEEKLAGSSAKKTKTI